MENKNPLEDDFTLGDVVKAPDEEENKKRKFLVFGIISFFLLILIIIIIIVVLSIQKSSSEKKDEEEEDPNTLSKIAIINCTFDINIIQNEISILNDDYIKSSKFYIFINGQKISFSKKYKFEKVGVNIVTFDIYEDINMDDMFKNIQELISVEMFTEKKMI